MVAVRLVLNLKSPKVKKNIQYFLLLIIVTGSLLASIFYPNFPVNLKPPYAYSNFENKRNNIANTINQINAINQQIPALEEKLNDARTKTEKSDVEYRRLLSKFNVGDWTKHVPSILVFLEQNAKYFELDFHLYHDKIQAHLPPAPQPAPERPDSTPPQEPPSLPPASERFTDEPQAQAAGSGQQPPSSIPPGQVPPTTAPNAPPASPDGLPPGQGTPQPVEGAPSTIDTLFPHFRIAHLPGVKSYIYPIRVIGKFQDVREYLHFLDDADFIEPSVIEITSKGDTVNAAILLHIFSVEGGTIQ